MKRWATKEFNIWRIAFSCLVAATAILSGCGSASSKSAFQQFVNQSNCSTAEQIYEDYQNNEVAAQQKYQGKFNRVCGVVEKIELNFANNPVVLLQASLFGVVSIGGLDTSSAANISKGSFSVFECSEINEIIGMPVLTACTVAPVQNMPNETLSDPAQTIQNVPHADANLADAQPSSGQQELWECDFGDPRGIYSVKLTATSYQFIPYNPDGEKLNGAVKMLKREDVNGTLITELEFVGSGSPPGRWGFVQGPGKRIALMTYAVESSGDGAECTLPGKQPQYVFN